MKRIIKVLSPNMIGAFGEFEKEKKKQEIRLGEFLWWLFREKEARK